MKKFAIAAMLLSATAATQAMENSKTICTHDTTTRIIEVVYTGEGALPCEVQYTKSEGPQTLWSAKNAENYCESKAAEFVEKQQNWGWTCVAEATQTEAPAVAETEAAPVEAEPAVETPVEAAPASPEAATSEIAPAETSVEQATEAQTSQVETTEENELTL